jgi:hypothetical protein
MKNSKPTLGQPERIVNYLDCQPTSEAIYIKIPTSRIKKLFSGNPARFFRTLKNGLHSIGGLSNRKFFEGFSGIYFYITTTESMEMVILYQSSYSVDNIKHRIKKLLGIDAEISFGTVEDFKHKIEEIIQIKTQCQFFGNAFFKKRELFKIDGKLVIL